MNRFDGLTDIDDEILRLVLIRLEEFFDREEERDKWVCLHDEERELDSLEETHPSLSHLVRMSVGGLGAALEDDLDAEALVWFRYNCLNSFLEVLGALAGRLLEAKTMASIHRRSQRRSGTWQMSSFGSPEPAYEEYSRMNEPDGRM